MTAQLNGLVDEVLGGRRIRIWTALGSDNFQVVSFRGREGLSRLYSFSMRLQTTGLGDVALDQLVGQTAHVEIELPNPSWEMLATGGNLNGLSTRRYSGLIVSAARTGSDQLYQYYRVRLVPKLWLHRLGRNYRAFHNVDTKGITSDVLGDLPVRWEIAEPLLRRNYCVQYGESNWAFVSRLLEEDGLFYYFEHRYDGQDDAAPSERMVITDNVERLAALQPTDTFEWDEIDGGNRDSMRIRRWVVKQRLVETSVDSLDRHFQLPSRPVSGTRNLPNEIDLGDNTTELASDAEIPLQRIYPANFAYRFDDVSATGSDQPDNLQQIFDASNHDAKLRTERLVCAAVDIRGTSDVAAFTPGYLFKLMRGVRVGQPFYLTEVVHDARLSNSARSGSDVPRLLYRNTFRCLPKTVVFRPERKHVRKRIRGLVPATVVNDENVTGDQVCVDKYGRVKVRFPWQDANDQHPSCWIRVSQFWAGNRWGAFFWPRVGHEVLVAFEHGDPDRPIVMGSVYNSENMPPLVLPQYKLSCGVHSCTHEGNPMANYNAVVFHDSPDEEFLQLHSETFESVTSETESLHHSAGRATQVLGENPIFTLISGLSSGIGGGEDADDDGSRTRFGAKGKASTAIGFLQLLGIIPRGGQVVIVAGAKISKTMGREWASCFGPRTHLIFDVKALLKKWLFGGITNTVGKFLLGAGSGSGASLLVVGSERKLVYGDEMKVLHGTALSLNLPTDAKATPGDNASILLVGIAQFGRILMGFMATLDLVCALVSRILLEVGGNSKKANSYTTASDIIECVTGVIMPFLLSQLASTQQVGAKLQMSADDAFSAVSGSKKVLTYAVSRVVSPGFKSAVTSYLWDHAFASILATIAGSADNAQDAVSIVEDAADGDA